MTWKKAALWAVFFIALAIAGTSGFDRDREPSKDADSGPREQLGKVQRVIDGDTIKVHLGPRTETVRYIGVDTPETVKHGTAVECFGPQASAFNKRVASHKAVRLIYDRERRDRYGRLLAYVYFGKRFINADLIRLGYATTLRIPPNTTHADEFDRLQRAAATRGRGLWRACPVGGG